MHDIGQRVFESRGQAPNRLKLAEVTSSVGALVLGVGIGAIMSQRIAGAGTAVAVVGAMLHAIGMWDKHRIESRVVAVKLWWVTALYWICWLLLAIGAVVLVMS